jgi:transporter family-2 protein
MSVGSPASQLTLLAVRNESVATQTNGSSNRSRMELPPLDMEKAERVREALRHLHNWSQHLHTEQEPTAEDKAEADAIEAARDRAVSQLLLFTCLIGLVVCALIIYMPDFPWNLCPSGLMARAGAGVASVREQLTGDSSTLSKAEKEERDGCQTQLRVAMYGASCFAGAVLVGVMSPIQATINAMVSEPYGSPLLAATLCQDIELLLLIPIAYVLFTSRSAAIAAGCEGDGVDPMLEGWMFAGGPLGGFYVLSLTMLRTMLAVEVTFVAVNLGQLLAATAMDQVGFAGLQKRPLTRRRALAIFVNILACIVLQIHVSSAPESQSDFTPIQTNDDQDTNMHTLAANMTSTGQAALNVLAQPGPSAAHWSAALVSYWFARFPSLDLKDGMGRGATAADVNAVLAVHEYDSKDDPTNRAMDMLNKADAKESPFTLGTLFCVVWAMFAGASATVQTCINTRLAKHVRGAWRASYINAAVSSTILALIYLWERIMSEDASIEALPWELPLWQTLGGGLLGVFCAVLPVILTPALGVATIYVVVLFGQLFCSMVWQIVVASIAGTLEPLVLLRCLIAALLSLFGSWLVRSPDT